MTARRRRRRRTRTWKMAAMGGGDTMIGGAWQLVHVCVFEVYDKNENEIT